MIFVDWRNADIASAHVLCSNLAIVLKSLSHDLLELVVILAGHYSGRRGTDDRRGVKEFDLIHVHLTPKRVQNDS